MNDFAPCSRRAALLSLATLAVLPAVHAASATTPPAAVPGDSVYRLQAPLVDQDGRAFEWSSLQGGPVLVSMFYTSCDMVCPMIFETVHATLKALPAAERSAVRVLMVSFDPARDTVAVLKKTAQARNCDAQWVLARGDETTARKVAGVLGTQYRRLSNGEFNHSTTITLLDRQGRIAGSSGKLGSADPALLAAVHKTLSAA
jgi:protein SCO1/2